MLLTSRAKVEKCSKFAQKKKQTNKQKQKEKKMRRVTIIKIVGNGTISAMDFIFFWKVGPVG